MTTILVCQHCGSPVLKWCGLQTAVEPGYADDIGAVEALSFDNWFSMFSGSNYYVRILSTIDRELLKPSASVALHKHSNALVDVLPPEADSSITMLGKGEDNFSKSLIFTIDWLIYYKTISWLSNLLKSFTGLKHWQ